METLPPEIVEIVSQHLTPQDLARCCAVSPKWREIFNQDWLWMQHCDPELEEPLRTIPSVVEPVFISPEVENSTLPEISKWRLAFMRQKHLCANLKRGTHRSHFPDIYHDSIYRSLPFMSDTLIVNWRLKRFEIWDVGVIPATLVAKTNPAVNTDVSSFSLLGDNMLFVKRLTSVQVFDVDVVKKSIKLKHEISLKDNLGFWGINDPILVDGSIFHVMYLVPLIDITHYTNPTIFDLGKGKEITEVHCPVMKNKNGKLRISYITALRTSDDVLVTFYDEKNIVYYFIFSPKQQVFLPGPIAENLRLPRCEDRNVINKHYVALGTMPLLTIIDYHTSEVVFKNDEGQQGIFDIQACKDYFLFVEERDSKGWLKIFSLKTKTLFVHIFSPDEFSSLRLKIVNDRFVILFNDINEAIASFDISSKTPKKITLSPPFSDFNCVVNSSFTRGVSYVCDYNGESSSVNSDDETFVINYYW